jgi:NAD(P)-dependent dehydrogenase (short-subunit alcohol dehydrogenase family)
MTQSGSVAPAALITGGARRIGRAITLALVEAGYAVAVQAHHSRAAAEELVRDIADRRGRAAVVEADLADHASVTALVPAARAAIGPLTLLVNNAAEFEPDEIGRLERERFDRHFAVNLRAPVFLAEAFAGQAPAGADASIVNLLDQRIYRPTPRFLSYGLTKSALHAATMTLAQALAPRIRVNAVAPGPTLPSSRQSDAAFTRQTRGVPLGHGPAAAEIAAAVVYLASAPSVTGVSIAVDGGQHLAWRTDGAEVTE